MTIAVCIRCGARKHGALTPCDGCGFDPAENLDKARSMILTDHFLAETDLDRIGERIRTGLPVNYPEEAVAEYVAMFERGADKLPLFLRIGCVIAILAVVAVVAFVVMRVV